MALSAFLGGYGCTVVFNIFRMKTKFFLFEMTKTKLRSKKKKKNKKASHGVLNFSILLL